MRRREALQYGEVLAWPRPWTCAAGTALKALGTPRPRWPYQRLRLPTGSGQRHRPCWVLAKRAPLRPLGDVTVGLSTWRRHDGPHQPTWRGTNRPEPVTARQSVAVSLNRGWVALRLRA